MFSQIQIQSATIILISIAYSQSAFTHTKPPKTKNVLASTGTAKCIVFFFLREKTRTANEIAPAMRKENSRQEYISCNDKKDAVDNNSFTSPAAIPFTRYTGIRIRNDTATVKSASKSLPLPWKRAMIRPVSIPGTTHKLYILSLHRSVNTAPDKNKSTTALITTHSFRTSYFELAFIEFITLLSLCKYPHSRIFSSEINNLFD